MAASTFLKSKYKLIIHIIVFMFSVFTIYVAITDTLRAPNEIPFQYGLLTVLLFIFTFYILALVIIPLLFKNWKKYLYLAVSYILFISVLLTWMKSVQKSNSVMLRKGILVEPLEYFTFESVLDLSLRLIPLGIMALIYNILVIDIKVLKKAFAVKRFELILNSIVISLLYFYPLIRFRQIEVVSIILISIYVVFFYTNVFHVAPILLKKKHFIKYTFYSFMLIIGVGLIVILLMNVQLNSISGLISVLSLIIFNLLIVITSLTYAYIRNRIKEKDLKLGSKDSELKLLKSQVNPHFLFNTLNTLYATALEEKAPKTAESTAKLANLIRYMQEDINKDFIPLVNEIKYVQDYIVIQQLRCAVEPVIDTKFKNIENYHISPGLLIPFVENAFKYGIDPSKPSKLSVSVVCNENSINFKCVNSYDERFKTYYKEQGFGIGIKNAKQRLELVYPKKHTFEVIKENNTFSVYISIKTK